MIELVGAVHALAQHVEALELRAQAQGLGQRVGQPRLGGLGGAEFLLLTGLQRGESGVRLAAAVGALLGRT